LFVFVEERYRANGLRSSAAMAQYLRSHQSHQDQARATGCVRFSKSRKGRADRWSLP
jgi:hypothetical protein